MIFQINPGWSFLKVYQILGLDVSNFILSKGVQAKLINIITSACKGTTVLNRLTAFFEDISIGLVIC